MDQTQRQLMKEGPRDIADESARAGSFLFGGLVLIVVGMILIMLANAPVADFAGAMLALMGLALAAASIWLYAQRS